MITIGFCGAAGSGKSTAAAQLTQHCGFHRVRFAGPLKAMIAAFGLSEAEIEGDKKETPCPLLCGRTPRQAMQWLGTQWGRDLIGETVWIEAWRAACARITDTDPAARIVADDVRFANEAAAIRARGGIVVRIDRPGAASASGSGHASEHLDFIPDLVILNHGDVRKLRAMVAFLAHDLLTG